MESVDFQIKLCEEEDWNTIVLGESPKEGELFKTKEQEERIAFRHSSVNIKDGKARIRGTRARGARYNGACNYIAGKQEYAVIISEDKERGIEVEYGEGMEIIDK